MKSRKNTMKRGGATIVGESGSAHVDTIIEAGEDDYFRGMYHPDTKLMREKLYITPWNIALGNTSNKEEQLNEKITSEEIAGGGSKRKSRKSRKTKKGRGAHEGGKKKCHKHCRRHMRRTRKGLKHRKN